MKNIDQITTPEYQITANYPALPREDRQLDYDFSLKTIVCPLIFFYIKVIN